MTGIVNGSGEPRLTLVIAGQSCSAVIDTGFNGDLELPESLRPYVNARSIGTAVSDLAGGQTIVEDLFKVDFPFDGQLVELEATFVPDATILVGTHMLRSYRLTIDFPARTVSLDRVA